MEQKVLGVTLPLDAPPEDVKNIKLAIVNLCVVIFVFLIWQVVYLTNENSEKSASVINFITLIGIIVCACSGIKGKNQTMLKFLSCCTFYMVFNVCLGIVFVLVVNGSHYQNCKNCIKVNATICRLNPRNEESILLDTSKGCNQYKLESEPRSIIYLLFCLIHIVLFAGVGLFGCKLSGMRYFAQQKNIGQDRQEQVYATGPVVVQAQPNAVIFGQPTIVQPEQTQQVFSIEQSQIVCNPVTLKSLQQPADQTRYNKESV
jgi:hypothetical protein